MNTKEIDSTVIRVLGGDVDTFEEFVRRYQMEVWKVLAQMLLIAQRTEDLVEQTFIKDFHPVHRSERGRDFDSCNGVRDKD